MITRKSSRGSSAFTGKMADAAPRWRDLLGRAVFLPLMLICVQADGAEPPGKGEQWRSVHRVRGRVLIESQSGVHHRTDYSHVDLDRTESVQIDFTLERVRRKEPEIPPGLTPELIALMRGQWAQEEAASDVVAWEAAPGTVKISMVEMTTSDEAYFPNEKRFTSRAEVNGVNLHSLVLELKPETGEWNLLTPSKLRDKYTIILTGTDRDMATNEIKSLDQTWEFDGVNGHFFLGTLSGKPGRVQGTAKSESGGHADSPHSRGISLGRISFWPEYADAELEVTIEGYAKWRPEGSITKPAQPGNHLVARGTLIPKGGGRVEDLPRIKKFRFELLDTTNEPGVCLNWPLKAKDTDFDLRLAAAVPLFPGQLSKKDQTNEVVQYSVDDEKRPYAETQINSYDFGGKATLRVICELEDGREIEGVMKSEGGEEPLPRIPKMMGPDWIAESWRKDKKVEKLPAQDDDEKVEGQNDNGDGFTLYEEYRGWVEQGKHLEGDPLKKDFFVRNEIGADAVGGIALFERVSKLRVHSKLRASEVVILSMTYLESEANAKGERIMNLNHRDAPHRVDQHAVRMITTSGYGSRGGGSDAVSNNDKTNRAFRPGKVQAIHLEERGRTNGIFSRKESTTTYNLSERDAVFAYDRGVAHELLHSVGVDHHGEGEEPRTFYFQGAGDPMNTLHRPRFVPYMPSSKSDFGKKVFGRPAVWSDFDRGPTITLIWEDTKDDVAQSLSADFERELTAERKDPIWARDGSEQAANYPQYGRDAAFWSEMDIYNSVSEGSTKRGILNPDAHRFDRFVTIGREHQADSGNELCLMRYYFANAYPVDATETAFYLVRPGKNRAGRDLCKSPEGTGANASSHDPKSRFGDSASGRGNCFSYICPNDAIPPRKL